jgi:nicotinic acid phosphoribosyltransferase
MGDFWTEKQQEDIAYFNENLETWSQNPLYKLKFIIISGKELKGIYDTFEAALGAAVVAYGSGEYIIQQILPEDETVNFLSPALALV